MPDKTHTETVNLDRRRFIGTAAMIAAAAELGMVRAAGAAAPKRSPHPAVPGSLVSAPTRTSFSAVRQIDAGVLNIGYVDVGPADGPVVILLHGWPYAIDSFADSSERLVSEGYRV